MQEDYGGFVFLVQTPTRFLVAPVGRNHPAWLLVGVTFWCVNQDDIKTFRIDSSVDAEVVSGTAEKIIYLCDGTLVVHFVHF